MATLSMAFLKPAGWFLAYWGILARLKLGVEVEFMIEKFDRGREM